ncbi:MAG: metallophosphoesterase [Deltaproteobacteria bacterium]|nr:metallophosphoesterase [Deltaproteobacteria bacterium]
MILPALTALVVAAPPAPEPPVLDFTRHDGTPRIVLIGDTGMPGPIVDRWRRTLAAKDKDAILVLGDLVYPQAPPCPKGVPDLTARRVLDAHLAKALEGLGAPVLLALGNHDTSWDEGDPPREKCVLAFVKPRADLELPAPYYAADFGSAVIVVLSSLALDDAQAAFAKRVFAAARPGARKILAAHHVLKTYHDKIDEDVIAPWLAKHGLVPDLWINGHAHVLQLGVYDGILALTSGTGALPRERPACKRHAPAASGEGGLAPVGVTSRSDDGCGPGQLFGSSAPGYAVLDIGADGRFTITFENADGAQLYHYIEEGK